MTTLQCIKLVHSMKKDTHMYATKHAKVFGSTMVSSPYNSLEGIHTYPYKIYAATRNS